jgi:hypothetical protein
VRQATGDKTLTLHANAANVNERKFHERCATSLGNENDKKVLFGADDENRNVWN